MDRHVIEAALETFIDDNVSLHKVESKGGGLGVFSERALPPGLEIGDYIGELLGSASVRKRTNDGSFRFEIGSDSGLYVDPIDNNGRVKYVSVVHYINEPSPGETCNCAFFADQVSSRMYIRTVCPIPAGVELLTTYGIHYKRAYPVNEEECAKPWDHWESTLRKNLAHAKENGMVVDDADSILGCRVGPGPAGRDLATKPPKTTEDGEPLCVLCGGEAERYAGPVIGYGDSNVHFKCALWSSEVYRNEDDNLMNVEKAVNRGRRLPCTLCGHKGSTVGCNEPKCRESFHYKCAEECGAGFDEAKMVVYCAVHKGREDEIKRAQAQEIANRNRVSEPTQQLAVQGNLVTCLWALDGMKRVELEKQAKMWAVTRRRVQVSQAGVGLKADEVRLRLKLRVILATWESLMVSHPELAGPKYQPPATTGDNDEIIIGSRHAAGWDLELRLTRGITVARTNDAALMCMLAKRVCSTLWNFALRDRSNKRRKKEQVQGEYIVEAVLDKRVSVSAKAFEWKVKWEGYDSTAEESTWEPLESLIGCRELLQDFEDSQPEDFQEKLAAALRSILTPA